MKRYVAGLMFSENGRDVALVRKKRPDWQKGKLNAIGGHIEDGETPLEAMVREFQEETSILHPGPLWQPLVRLFRPGAFEVYFYSTRSDMVYGVLPVTDEHVEYYDLLDVRTRKVVPSINWLIPMALDTNILREKFIEIEDVRGD